MSATKDSQEDTDALAKEETQEEEQQKSSDDEAKDADALVEQQMLEALAKEETQEEEQQKSSDDEAKDADALVEQQMLEALAKEETQEGTTDGKDSEPMAQNVLPGEPGTTVKPAQFQSLNPAAQEAPSKNIEMLMDVTLAVSIELGRTTMQVKRILELGPGSVIELNKMAGEPVDVLVNNKLIARGEVVVVDENFGIRVTDLVSPSERLKSL